MAYADSLLASGEQIVLRERQHWFVLIWNARWGLLGLLVGFIFLLLRAAGSLPSGFFGDLIWLVTLVLLFGGAIWLLWSVLRWQNQEYVVTSRRIVVAEGVINKKATDSSLEKINDAVLTTSLFGRIFGFGDLDVLTASEAGIERLRMLVDATGFKKAMLDAKYDLERELAQQLSPTETARPAPAAQAATPRQGMSSDEVTATLARLADLRDRMAITPEEYEAKKRELLGRL